MTQSEDLLGTSVLLAEDPVAAPLPLGAPEKVLLTNPCFLLVPVRSDGWGIFRSSRVVSSGKRIYATCACHFKIQFANIAMFSYKKKTINHREHVSAKKEHQL